MADSSLRNREFEDIIEIRRWKTSILGESISLWVIKIRGEFYFFGKEVATELGYAEPKKTIQNRIDDEEKKTIEEMLGVNYKKILEKSLKSSGDKLSLPDFFRKVQMKQKLITEFALYEFCATSKKDRARPFHKWIFSTIVKIRKTGSYTLPEGPIDNPLDLVTRPPALERKVAKTCDRGTQTPETIDPLLKNKLKKTIKKAKEIKFELEKYLRKSSSNSDSSSHSSSCRYYSSDSD